MSGFVSIPSNAPANAEANVVAGDLFWPSLILDDARDSLRLGSQVTDIRLRDALRGGMIGVRRELALWQLVHAAAGALTLADIGSAQVDGEAVAVILYRRAVYAMAGADLVETHNMISATADGKDRAGQEMLTADDHRRNATHAIRDMLGVSRTAVELI